GSTRARPVLPACPWPATSPPSGRGQGAVDQAVADGRGPPPSWPSREAQDRLQAAGPEPHVVGVLESVALDGELPDALPHLGGIEVQVLASEREHGALVRF